MSNEFIFVVQVVVFALVIVGRHTGIYIIRKDHLEFFRSHV